MAELGITKHMVFNDSRNEKILNDQIYREKSLCFYEKRHTCIYNGLITRLSSISTWKKGEIYARRI
jgi:hypothetical protein